MERVNFYSPISGKEICLGGIVETSKGLWLPKMKYGLNTCQNIKDGCGQITRGQARNVVIRAYYEATGARKGWERAKIEEKLAEAYEREAQKNQAEAQKREAENIRLEEARRISKEGEAKVTTLGEFDEFKLYKVESPSKTVFKVKLSKVKNWKNHSKRAVHLGLGVDGQRCWTFKTFESAVSFLSLVRTNKKVGMPC